jgi:hypothetical protein
MRKSVIAVAIATMLMASNSVAQVPVTEYSIVTALVDLVKSVTDSSVSKEQKDRLLQKVEAWKKLPPTKENYDYVVKETAKIKTTITQAGKSKSSKESSNQKSKPAEISNQKPAQPAHMNTPSHGGRH